MWKTVLFDLDGTLTDSAEGITKCVQHALVSLGFDAPELSELECFVGPPLQKMFMKYADLDEETAEQAVELYRERYVPTGMYENKLYPSVIEMLDLFKKNGIVMGVASSKPEIYVKRILDYFGISSYFKVVVGSELNGERVNKKDVLEEAIKRLKMEKSRDQIVLVGDTEYDVLGANEADIDCIAVTYGYGDRNEIEKVRPVYIADTVSEIADCVLSCDKKPKRESSIYQVWRIMYPIIGHLAISLLVYSVWAIGYAFYEVMVNGNYAIDVITERLYSQNSVTMIVVSLISIGVFGWFFKQDELYRKDLGIRSRLMTAENFGVLRMIGVSVFFILSGLFLNQMITWSRVSLLFDGYDSVSEILFDKKSMIVTYLSVGVLAPMAEEFAFRGLVYRRVRDYIDVKWAIIISSVLFGLYHGNMVQFIYASLIGVLLAAVYERYKTLWAPIVAHMAANTFSCICQFMGVELMPTTMKGFVCMLLVEILVISIMGVCILRKWTPKRAAEKADTKVIRSGMDQEPDTDTVETAVLMEEVTDETVADQSKPAVEKASYRDPLDDLDDDELDRIIAAYNARKEAAAAAEAEELAAVEEDGEEV